VIGSVTGAPSEPAHAANDIPTSKAIAHFISGSPER
jgi:hypothetical protein